MEPSVKNEKWVLKEYLIPFLILLLITGTGIALFMVVIGLGKTIAPVNLVQGEQTKPTVGRLIYLIAAMIGFVCCAVAASRCAKNEKLFSAFFVGFVAGLFLWQAVGEAAWHFGYRINGEYVNFIRIETSASFFLVIVFAFLIVYLVRKSALDFGILCTVLSFLCDWFGHFIMEGTYPFVSGIMEPGTWYSIIGFTAGIALTGMAVLLPIVKYKDRRGHLLCAMLLYIGISVIAFGFMG